jgi:hypothetical protein
MDAEEKPYRYVVRFPPQLRDQIVEAAQYYRRSRNSEIVVRLEQSFRGVLADRTKRDVQIAAVNPIANQTAACR